MSIYGTMERFCQGIAKDAAGKIVVGKIQQTTPELVIRLDQRLCIKERSIIKTYTAWGYFATGECQVGDKVILLFLQGVYLLLDKLG